MEAGKWLRSQIPQLIKRYATPSTDRRFGTESISCWAMVVEKKYLPHVLQTCSGNTKSQIDRNILRT